MKAMCEWLISKKITGFISYSSAAFQMDHAMTEEQKILALQFTFGLLTLLP